MELSNLLIKLIGFWYGLISICLFALYGLDKKQSIIGGKRIPEKTLHLTALAGGFLGGLMGRALFHHKTRKPVFMIILLSSAILHGILWIIILS